MKRVFFLANLLAILAILAIADTPLAQDQQSNDGTEPRTAVPKQAEAPVPNGSPTIGQLETKDRIIMITKGSKGPLYTVKTKDGKILARRINGKNLQAMYPDIYSQIKKGVAGNDASLY